jgi:hypothetical protein
MGWRSKTLLEPTKKIGASKGTKENQENFREDPAIHSGDPF